MPDLTAAELEAMCDRLAASVIMLAHDAHPTYANTAGWRGGIGGQTITTGCSIIDPPPGEDWTQCDLPTSVARDWIQRRRDIDLNAMKAVLRAEWEAMLAPTAAPITEAPAPESEK